MKKSPRPEAFLCLLVNAIPVSVKSLLVAYLHLQRHIVCCLQLEFDDEVTAYKDKSLYIRTLQVDIKQDRQGTVS